jgi:DNA-binding NarL/FixJ family response regulator
VRLVVAEDSALLRAGLVELLAATGFDVVGQAADAEKAVALVRELEPDAVVLDIRMPPTHTLEGLVAARTIRQERGTAIGIVLLSQYVETRYALDLMVEGAGGFGYLLKDRVLDIGELADAIRRVASGGTAVDPVVIEHLMRRRRDDDLLLTLTDREREVLAAMAEGRSNTSIAGLLHVSPKTVEACTSRIFVKLGLPPDDDQHRRVRAVLEYLKVSRP